MKNRIGFVSTRFSGTDGVSLESSKWAHVFEQSGYSTCWFAGDLDRSARQSVKVPEAHFEHPTNRWINQMVFGQTRRDPELTEAIHAQRSFLKRQLHQFIDKFKIDILIAENVLCLPMHVPLGLALTETVAETQIPTIAHHHDFYWERSRYALNAVADYLHMAFPPNLPHMVHVVINSTAREDLALRAGVAPLVIPNVMDYDNTIAIHPEKCRAFRASLGLESDDIIILQPTRVVQRKGIEHAIHLVKALKNPRAKLVISHEAGDEGYDYSESLINLAADQGVDLRLVSARLSDPWNSADHDTSPYPLWEIYACSDFITYPSLCEGFGNAFLEAVYFKKPLLVNRYSSFIKDIEPLGFDLVTMDGFLSTATVEQVDHLLSSPRRCFQMGQHNFDIARKHFSYRTLRKQLNIALTELLDDNFEWLQENPHSNLIHLCTAQRPQKSEHPLQRTIN